MDFDNESLLRCFCSEEEEQEIISWNKENGHARSDIFEFSSWAAFRLLCAFAVRAGRPAFRLKEHMQASVSSPVIGFVWSFTDHKYQGLEEADKLREEGNEFFKSGNFDTARQRYYGAIWHLDFDIGQQWNLMDKHQLDLNTRRLDWAQPILAACTRTRRHPV